jgi:hypothetical protein
MCAAMQLTFLYPSNFAMVFQDDRNKGIEAVPALLEQLERRGAKVTRIDPNTLTQDQRIHEYSRAIIPAVYKKYEVKRIFGTNRHSACWFGVQVPALIVKRDSDDIVGDTYPHRKPPNTVVTIHDYLSVTLAALAESPEATSKKWV